MKFISTNINKVFGKWHQEDQDVPLTVEENQGEDDPDQDQDLAGGMERPRKEDAVESMVKT